MTVGIFVDFYEPFVSGVVTSVNTLAEYLIERGHQVIVFAPYIPGHKDNKAFQVVRVPSLGFGRSRIGIPIVQRGLLEKIRDLHLDIIHIQGPYFTGFLGIGIAQSLKIRVVMTYHTDIVQTLLLILGPWKWVVGFWVKMLALWAVRRCVSSCDFIFAPSNYVLRRLRRYGAADDKISVLPTAVKIPSAKLSRDEARRKLNLLLDKEILLYVGRLSGEKNLEMLLRAFRLVVSKRKSALLVIVGAGPLRKKLAYLAQKFGIRKNVIFIGEIPRLEVNDYYCVANLFVHPSRIETQGLVVSEAAALGTPAVVINAGGVVEYMTNLRAGFATTPDPERFAEAILSLLNDPMFLRSCGENALHDVVRLDPILVYPPLIHFYEAAISCHKTSSPL